MNKKDKELISRSISFSNKLMNKHKDDTDRELYGFYNGYSSALGHLLNRGWLRWIKEKQ